MRWNPRLWLSGLRLHVRIWLIVGSLNLITLVLTIWLLTWMTRRFVEDAIGDQMVVQARHGIPSSFIPTELLKPLTPQGNRSESTASSSTWPGDLGRAQRRR